MKNTPHKRPHTTLNYFQIIAYLLRVILWIVLILLCVFSIKQLLEIPEIADALKSPLIAKLLFILGFCVMFMAVWIIMISVRSKVLQRQLEDENRTIINSVPAMIWYKNSDNRILRCNQLAAEMRGMTIEAMEGRLTTELYPQEAEAYWSDDLEVIQSGHPKRGIIEPVQTVYGKKWIRTDKIPYRNEKNEIIGVIVFAIDITQQMLTATEKENLVKKLQMTLQLLKKSNDELEQFAYSVSHDLKAPLRAIAHLTGFIE